MNHWPKFPHLEQSFEIQGSEEIPGLIFSCGIEAFRDPSHSSVKSASGVPHLPGLPGSSSESQRNPRQRPPPKCSGQTMRALEFPFHHQPGLSVLIGQEVCPDDFSEIRNEGVEPRNQRGSRDSSSLLFFFTLGNYPCLPSRGSAWWPDLSRPALLTEVLSAV